MATVTSTDSRRLTYTAAEAAALLGCSASALQRHHARFHGLRVGSRYLFPKWAIDGLLLGPTSAPLNDVAASASRGTEEGDPLQAFATALRQAADAFEALGRNRAMWLASTSLPTATASRLTTDSPFDRRLRVAARGGRKPRAAVQPPQGMTAPGPEPAPAVVAYRNTRGATYFLHGKEVTLQNRRKQAVHYFKRELDPKEALTEIPVGKSIKENKKSGLPYLTRARAPR